MPVPRITKEELKQRLEAGDASAAPVLLDVRLKYAYEHSTLVLPGAVRMHPAALDLSTLPRDRDIVAYDSDPDETTSAQVAATLIRNGFRASVLKGGIPEWIAANLPLDTKDAPKPAPVAPGSLKG